MFREPGNAKIKRPLEWVSSAVRDKQTDSGIQRSHWLRALQDSDQRDELGIDLRSLSFFVKQDLRTQARALFKSLPIHIHIY